MSDIKNENALEEIKEAVEDLKTTGNFGKLLALSNAENGTNRVNQFFVNTIITLITTIESQKEEIEKWREFGKETIRWYKDNDWPIKAIDVQAKLDWISYTPTLCEIEKQAEHWQEGDK